MKSQSLTYLLLLLYHANIITHKRILTFQLVYALHSNFASLTKEEHLEVLVLYRLV